MEYNNARAPALLAFFTGACRGCITYPAPKVRSPLCVRIFTGMNRICWLRIAREFIDSDFARF